MLKSVLGMAPHGQMRGLFVRAMAVIEGATYAICGGRLFRIYLSGEVNDLGEVTTGRASISGNNGLVTIHAGARYFVYEPATGTISEPMTGAFSGFGSVEYFDNYTVLTQSDGRMFQWSDLADPRTLDGLSFSTADGRDDDIVRACALFGQLWLFKQTSHEKWYNTGGAGAEAIQRVAGGVQYIGLKAHDLICRFDGGAFMVGSDNRASLIGPGGIQPVSTPPVEIAIRNNLPLCCITYADEGHVFACIIFKNSPAWCYDIANGMSGAKASA